MTIDRALTLKGVQAGVVATSSVRAAAVALTSPTFAGESFIGGTVAISAPNVTLNGFTVDTGTNSFGINLTGSYADYKILNTISRDNAYGIILNGTDGSTNSLIDGNAIINNNKGPQGHGISAQSLTKNLTISDNYFAGNYNAGGNSESVNFYGLGSGQHSGITLRGNVVKDSSLVFANLTGLTITGNDVEMVDTQDSTALFVAGDVHTADINHNILKGTTRSFYISPDFFGIPTASSGFSLHNNALLGSTTGAEVASGRLSDASLDATCNWWGSASGPRRGGGGCGHPCYRRRYLHALAHDKQSCRVMRGRPYRKLKVTKVANGGNGVFNFTGDLGSFTITTVAGTGSTTLSGIPVGTYTVTETATSTWTQNSSTCASVTVSANQTATCTVTNTKNTGKITVTKHATGGDGTFSFTGSNGLGAFTITTSAVWVPRYSRVSRAVRIT